MLDRLWRLFGRTDRDERIRAGAYELQVRTLHTGTRSEGRIGRLYCDGSEVHPSATGGRIEVDTPTGTVVFVHVGDERPHLWSTSGWTVERDDRSG